MSICGGNFQIIHEVEQNGISFDYCYELCVLFHNKEIIEWLLSQYKCEIFPPTKCLEFCDYETFLFFYFNGIKIKNELHKTRSIAAKKMCNSLMKTNL